MSYKVEAQRLFKAFDQYGKPLKAGVWVLNFPDPNLLAVQMLGPSEVAPGVSGMTVVGANWSLKASPSGEVAVLTGSEGAFDSVMCDVNAYCPVLREAWEDEEEDA